MHAASCLPKVPGTSSCAQRGGGGTRQLVATSHREHPMSTVDDRGVEPTANAGADHQAPDSPTTPDRRGGIARSAATSQPDVEISRRLPPWHPPLLAAWSVLALWAGNLTEVPASDGLLLLGIVVGAVLVAWLVLALLAHVVGLDEPVSRAALATTIGAAGVLLAGRLASGLEPRVGLAVVAGLAVLGIVIASVLGRSALAVVTTVLDVFTLVVVAMVAVPVGSLLLRPDSVPEGGAVDASAAVAGSDAGVSLGQHTRS